MPELAEDRPQLGSNSTRRAELGEQPQRTYTLRRRRRTAVRPVSEARDTRRSISPSTARFSKREKDADDLENGRRREGRRRLSARLRWPTCSESSPAAATATASRTHIRLEGERKPVPTDVGSGTGARVSHKTG